MKASIGDNPHKKNAARALPLLRSRSLLLFAERETCPLAARGSSPRPPLRRQQQHGRHLALRRRRRQRHHGPCEEARRRRVLRARRFRQFRRRRRRPGRARPFPRGPRSPCPLRRNRAPLTPSERSPVQARRVYLLAAPVAAPGRALMRASFPPRVFRRRRRHRRRLMPQQQRNRPLLPTLPPQLLPPLTQREASASTTLTS